jgi:hypothetical protein
LPVEYGVVAADVALVFQALQAPPSGRLRERKLLAKLGAAQARIGLQGREDAAVDGVNIGGGLHD